MKERGDFQLHTEKTHCLACGGFLCLLEWKITHRHNTEKYYCQRFPEMPSRSPSVLPRREAVGCFSVCFFPRYCARRLQYCALTTDGRRDGIRCHMLSQSHQPSRNVPACSGDGGASFLKCRRKRSAAETERCGFETLDKTLAGGMKG